MITNVIECDCGCGYRVAAHEQDETFYVLVIKEMTNKGEKPYNVAHIRAACFKKEKIFKKIIDKLKTTG